MPTVVGLEAGGWDEAVQLITDKSETGKWRCEPTAMLSPFHDD